MLNTDYQIDNYLCPYRCSQELLCLRATPGTGSEVRGNQQDDQHQTAIHDAGCKQIGTA